MRDLSLHVLDLLENSIRAGATLVALGLRDDPEKNRLEITVEDNGPGLAVPAEAALDPFYTTKNGKKTGLGLSLFQATARQAGGELWLSRSALGGLKVRATLERNHIDRIPLGDLAATISGVACTNPDLEIACHFEVSERCFDVRLSELKTELSAGEREDGLSVARLLALRIRAGLSAIGVSE